MSYVEKVFLKSVNQGNIQSVVLSMHVTNSDKKIHYPKWYQTITWTSAG